MGKIRVLPEQVANKIAAGEVVERPSAIVKELTENSLDAGASQIEVCVRHGGKSFIRVTDNGAGMSAEDAQISVQRHATSKIEKAEDLDEIRSFGFRGEALSSIAAVSRFTLQSRAEGADIGIELVIEGGSLVKAKECSVARGTTVEVRDLFFNTPARRRFLRQDSTEFGHILDAVTCLALANLNVHFTLISQEQVVLDLIPTEDLPVRARAIFGDHWADRTLLVRGDIPYAKISGLIGKPELASRNRHEQFFFVNKRWVKAYALSHALQAGYHGFLMQNQFPAAILFLDVDPRNVDVNVHPTKQQVRLSHEGMIKSLVEKTVSQALNQNQDPLPRSGVAGEMSLGEPPSQPISHTSDLSFGNSESGASFKVAEGSNDEDSQPSAVFPIFIGKEIQITKILGQIHRTYIVAETEEGFVLVDQHAAHERVMFEILMKNFQSQTPARQKLLIEETFDLHPRQVETMRKYLEFLNQIGFETEWFGERSFVVRGVPSILADVNPVTILKSFVEEKEGGKVRTSLKGAEEDVAAIVACKRRSVKASDPLNLEEMRGLLKSLGQCQNPFHCPHGRPTLIRHATGDIEKQFGRRG